MDDAWNDLPTFDAQECPAFFAEESASARNAAVGLAESRRLTRMPTKRSFEKVDNAARLLGRLPEPGETIHCVMAAHVVDVDVFAFVHAGLAGRGQRIAAVRSHAKLLLFEMAGGAAYVVESSANLRSCRNVEQFALTHDRTLLDFHAAWMEELFTAAAGGPA